MAPLNTRSPVLPPKPRRPERPQKSASLRHRLARKSAHPADDRLLALKEKRAEQQPSAGLGREAAAGAELGPHCPRPWTQLCGDYLVGLMDPVYQQRASVAWID